MHTIMTNFFKKPMEKKSYKKKKKLLKTKSIDYLKLNQTKGSIFTNRIKSLKDSIQIDLTKLQRDKIRRRKKKEQEAEMVEY